MGITDKYPGILSIVIGIIGLLWYLLIRTTFNGIDIMFGVAAVVFGWTAIQKKVELLPGVIGLILGIINIIIHISYLMLRLMLHLIFVLNLEKLTEQVH